IDFVVEPTLLGTGGAIKFACEQKKIEDNVLVCNGDTYFTEGLKYFYEYAKGEPSIGLVKIDRGNRYGLVRLSQDGYLEDFLEKDQKAIGGLINMGLYFFSKEILKLIPPGSVSLEKDILQGQILAKKMRGILLSTYFIDIGVPEDYEKFCKDFKNGIVN
ncbi:MAG: sugar phosphate nucleotidyltransferase, partial [Pseudobdellovibrionaceae bacterium]